MDEFTHRYRCPKCGGGWVETNWCQGDYHCPRSLAGEHMHRACQKCGYEKIELPLDMETEMEGGHV